MLKVTIEIATNLEDRVLSACLYNEEKDDDKIEFLTDHILKFLQGTTNVYEIRQVQRVVIETRTDIKL